MNYVFKEINDDLGNAVIKLRNVKRLFKDVT